LKIIGHPHKTKRRVRKADPGETTRDVEAVTLHDEKGHAEASHDRHEKKMELVRGDALFSLIP
jgi:hypothetical protein